MDFNNGFDMFPNSLGFCWDRQTMRRFDRPEYLEQYGYKVYSQNDEDGIIAEIFRRIGTTDKRFIEFGVENGIETNTHYLLFHGWSGLWIDGSEKSVLAINRKFKQVIDKGQLKVRNDFIDRDNVNQLFLDSGFSGEIDLLSIDIDGNDYHIMRAIEAVSPRVLIIEYNAKFPPNCDWHMAYNPIHRWDGSDCYGASLKSLELLGADMGYQLAGTNFNGVNAFFVKSELASDLFPKPATAENLYNPPRFHQIKYTQPFPGRVCLLGGDEAEDGVYSYSDDIMFYPLYGFYFAEYDKKGYFLCQWMNSKTARFLLKNPGYPCGRLSIKTLRNKAGKLNVTVNGAFSQELLLKTLEYEEFVVPLDRQYKSGEILTIDFEAGELWMPDTADKRPLGVGVRYIGLE